jgi:ATP-dependent RNA helicase DeaD
LYIHRIGRTGRVDKRGRAITLLAGVDDHEMNRIKSQFDLKPVTIPTPTREETLRMLSDRRMRELKERLQVSPVIPDEFRTIARDIIADEEAEDIVSLLVDHFLAEAPGEPSPPPPPHGAPGSGPRRRKRR